MEKELKILITIKTYPTPSIRYREIVCTAGVDENGNWFRLYPIDFRYRVYSQWYKKYQWIEVKAKKYGRDGRPESYKPIGDIKTGSIVDTKNNWEERKRIIFKNGYKTMCFLNSQKQTIVSLGAIKLKKVVNFYWEETSRNWSQKQLQTINQLHLFNKNKPLEKIPYQFKYKFYCEELDCKGHDMMLEDWEVMELYRKMRDKYGEQQALKKVKDRFLDFICSQKKIHIFL